MLVLYGYARLVGYRTDWSLAPDILAGLDVEEGRIFTLHLRKGHKWSDGHPFTAEDFRFYWEHVASDPQLSPAGPDRILLVDGEPPAFEVIDDQTVRYTWPRPNPHFLPALAGARPEYIYVPAHYAKRYHPAFADPQALQRIAAAEGQRNWQALYTHKVHPYRNDNPELPTLQPWVLKTEPPATRFVYTRNPFYYRVDTEGRQLPYIDTAVVTVSSPQLIPAKTASGEADLQARHLSFENYTVLKQGEERSDYTVHLWKSARGSELAIFPNLNVADPAWRALFRNADFRRALSLAVDRNEINEVLFYGLAQEGADTILPSSPLFKPKYQDAWARHDLGQANRLLDGLGLAERQSDGTRTLSDGRPLRLVVETAGEDPIQVAMLQLTRDAWRKAGIELFIKAEERQTLRNRVFAGLAQLSVWYGLENGLPVPGTPPDELAPTSQMQLNWPQWGQHYESSGHAGTPVDTPEAQELARLHRAWLETLDEQARARIWHEMLSLRAQQVFSIGTVRLVPQPVVVANDLRNVPDEGIYNWDPGAHFGVYRPDTFWFAAGE
jgi:peptide/nickel transport system substrate-binding protein